MAPLRSMSRDGRKVAVGEAVTDGAPVIVGPIVGEAVFVGTSDTDGDEEAVGDEEGYTGLDGTGVIEGEEDDPGGPASEGDAV